MRINLAWLYAITKYGYPPPFDDILRAFRDAKRLGFEAVELEAVGARNLDELCERKRMVSEELDALGLRMVNFAGIFREVFAMDGTVRRRGMELFERSAALAAELGSSTIQTDSFTPPIRFRSDVPYEGTVSFGRTFAVEVDPTFSWDSFWARLIGSLKQLASIAEGHGLRFVIEPRVGETISNSEGILRALEAIGSPNFGVVLDCGHLHAQKELLPLSIEKLGGRIWYVHVSDNDGRDNYHLAPGRGTIDWRGVFAGLNKHGYSGYFAVDVGGQEVSQRLDEEVLMTRKFLEENLAKYAFA